MSFFGGWSERGKRREEKCGKKNLLGDFFNRTYKCSVHSEIFGRISASYVSIVASKNKKIVLPLLHFLIRLLLPLAK